MERNIAIDITKALCILLVVIGHYTPADAPEGYKSFVDFIYTFHMPVFMWASGFLYIYAFRPLTYVDHVRKKSRRLLLPYLAASIVIISLKLLSGSNLSVDHPTTVGSFVEMFYRPAAGYFLWYLWALFIIFLIVPLFSSPKARIALLAGSLAVSMLPIDWPTTFSIDQAVRFLPYFALGTCCADAVKKSSTPANVSRPALLAVAIATMAASVSLFIYEPLQATFAEPIMAMLGLISIVSLAVIASRRARHPGWLLTVADSTFIIYLFHTTFQGLAKASLEKILPGTAFAFNAIFIFAAGCIGPMVLHYCVLNQSRITRYIFAIAPARKHDTSSNESLSPLNR